MKYSRAELPEMYQPLVDYVLSEVDKRKSSLGMRKMKKSLGYYDRDVIFNGLQGINANRHTI